MQTTTSQNDTDEKNDTRDFDVIFGTGPLGQAVARALTAKNRRVHIINRSGKAPAGLPSGAELHRSDVATDLPGAIAICRGASVIYRCVNSPYHQWQTLLMPLIEGMVAVAAATGAKLIASDNLSMYGANAPLPLTETTPQTASTRKGIIRRTLSSIRAASAAPMTAAA